MATAEFSKFADILSAALSQHHLLGFEIAQLEFHCLREVQSIVKKRDMNKAGAGVGTPAELFQILKDDAVKVLHSIC